ncbi:hypothetical protein ISF_08259 [Cordyceps fumosorosea ARSEF 2679]|uniref:Uncharacterized protein n=1 Tax=Cordyceps fumosorosea (strain ARSEF 2679) TaxID=1081104 RepID=A0A167MQY8_CORFA|nr:hypothetical protein ISF_08259 [Cordyceps fumosorosea ARSEF 2679]OAA54658.1 hypothetical protein ISF_08259 [Cordyceps fumosorosea ARSEF 2679]
MPYLNRRTVRSLLARRRPSPSPAPSLQAETSPPASSSAPTEPQSPPLALSFSAPVGLPGSPPPSSQTSLRAVTANEAFRSPAASVSASNDHNTNDEIFDAARSQSSHSPERQAHAPDASQQRQATAYLEAGIPIASDDLRAPPTVFAPHLSGHVPSTDSPPYEFNGLFAVPAAPSGNPPATPGAPPLYQPHAPPAETFPQLPFTPFHRNAMLARSEQVEHELPGDDRFPHPPDSRVVNGSWLGGRFEPFTVGDRTFFCPVHLLLRYPHWRLLLSLERPPSGCWALSPSVVDPAVFALILEALVSPAGFDGTERGLSLVLLALAARQALDWGMHAEVAKLVASARRLVARRVFYRDPHAPDARGVMDHNYFVHRSEDIFRAWRVLTRSPPELQRCLPPAEMVCLYALAVPRDLWPALTAEFPDEFAALIDLSARLRVVPGEVDYHDWWLRFFRRAGCLDFDWMADVPDLLGMFYRGQEESARDRPEMPTGAQAAAEATE